MTGPSSRMLRLLSLLQARRDWAGDELAERLETSTRTIRRDVERLRDLGYRIESLRGPLGGYRMTAGSELPPLLFDDDQAVAVALALAVAPASGADIAESAARALATVRQLLPSRLRHRVDAVQIVASPGRTPVDPEVLVVVSDAVRRRQLIAFDYAPVGRDDARTHRRVAPHAVVARDGRWYLLAWDDRAGGGDPSGEGAPGDWRTFRIDRILPGPPTYRTFAPRPIPGGDAGGFVSGLIKGSADADAWPCVGTAVVHLPARRITPFVDADAAVVAQGEDRTAVTMGSWSWVALAARFAGFDAPLEIVGPAELVRGAAEVVRRLGDTGPAATARGDATGRGPRH